MNAIKVMGNNEGLYSEAAYNELRLQLSTGDYHTHRTERVRVTGDNYHTVIQVSDIVPGSCDICERLGVDAESNEDVSFPICKLCYEEYKLRHERFEFEGELKRVRDRFNDSITFKQYRRIQHGNEYYTSIRKITKSKKVLALVDRMEELCQILSAYTAAMDDIRAEIKSLGGFKQY